MARIFDNSLDIYRRDPAISSTVFNEVHPAPPLETVRVRNTNPSASTPDPGAHVNVGITGSGNAVSITPEISTSNWINSNIDYPNAFIRNDFLVNRPPSEIFRNLTVPAASTNRRPEPSVRAEINHSDESIRVEAILPENRINVSIGGAGYGARANDVQEFQQAVQESVSYLSRETQNALERNVRMMSEEYFSGEFLGSRRNPRFRNNINALGSISGSNTNTSSMTKEATTKIISEYIRDNLEINVVVCKDGTEVKVQVKLVLKDTGTVISEDEDFVNLDN
jgi:hypothetical protein